MGSLGNRIPHGPPWSELAFSLTVLLVVGPAGAQTVPHFVEGRSLDAVDLEETAHRNLTVIDLSDDWTPGIFAEDLSYRETLLRLANETAGVDDAFRHARADRYVELYGVFPSLAVVRVRLADEPRHACHEAIDDAPLRLPPDERSPAAAVSTMQAHLACDGLLPTTGVDGRFGPVTGAALAAYRQRHMVPTVGPLDEPTVALLTTSSRELDFRALLRALRERVVDATGLIEDGSAAGAWGQVLGRDLDAAALRDVDGFAPLPRAAPDLISPATEAAARALGWTGPDEALAAMVRLPSRVAVALPPPPAHDRDVLALRAEIDRGEVQRSFARRNRPVARRPSLVLYADTAGGPLALVRWPTTIGGWQREKTARGVVWRYKESTPGDFVWRDLVVAPAWFPPPSTPDRELVRRGPDGRWELREDTFGPGHRSAYGLVMLMHHRVSRSRAGELRYADTAVRTHGSASYTTIRGGASHGCHRLYNHLAVRLAAFVLRHRPHQVIGVLEEPYRRRVSAGGRTMWIRRELRGYGYRLDEPVPVRILGGAR